MKFHQRISQLAEKIEHLEHSFNFYFTAQEKKPPHVLPDARAVMLPGVGHWPQLENPEAFEGALLDFLAQPGRVLH